MNYYANPFSGQYSYYSSHSHLGTKLPTHKALKDKQYPSHCTVNVELGEERDKTGGKFLQERIRGDLHRTVALAQSFCLATQM